MGTAVENGHAITDEDYLVLRAKKALESDPYAAKAWMITAKTLFPDNFAIQFEAYNMEKAARNVKEAGKCFSAIFQKFQEVPEMWHEVQALTTALRTENGDAEAVFLREMFVHMPLEVQHQLLLVAAERSEDTMEHCRLVLLLLRRFPRTVLQQGPGLVDTLMAAEKHSHYQNSVNCYRKLLVCDLLPLLGSSSIDLSPKQLFRLMHKSIEFYLCYLMSPNKVIQDLPELESKIEDPWKNLFMIQECIGRKLGWELSGILGHTWNKELYWQKITQFHNTRMSHGDEQQLLYCTTTFFLHCLHEYIVTLEAAAGETSVVLVEAFCTEVPEETGEPKAKHRKVDAGDETLPLLTGSNVVIRNFQMALHCWDLLHSSDSLSREFAKLSQHLKLETWLQGFLIDAALYKGQFVEARNKIINTESSRGGQALLRKHLQLASALFCENVFSRMLEHVLQVVTSLPSTAGPPVNQLINILQQPSTSKRHVHFLPLTRSEVLQYCVKLVLAALKFQYLSKPRPDNDLAIGHMITLLQYDWPLEEDLMVYLIERIRQQGSFSYGLFQHYVINIDLLEEFMYLSTDQGGNVMLDIMPSIQLTSQRRISTRGADKGVKEDFKLAMKRQVARCDEPIDCLVTKFLTTERELVLESLQ